MKQKISHTKKGVLLAAGLLILLCTIGGAIYLFSVSRYQQAVKNMEFSNISISELADGTYTGQCDVNFVAAKVAVTVKDGVLQSIELLEHKNGRGAPAEKIIDDMVIQQTIDVDAVTGATNSSKVIMKAVENALLQQ